MWGTQSSRLFSSLLNSWLSGGKSESEEPEKRKPESFREKKPTSILEKRWLRKMAKKSRASRAFGWLWLVSFFGNVGCVRLLLPAEERLFFPEDLNCLTLQSTRIFQCDLPEGSADVRQFAIVGQKLWVDHMESLKECIDLMGQEKELEKKKNDQ